MNVFWSKQEEADLIARLDSHLEHTERHPTMTRYDKVAIGEDRTAVTLRQMAREGVTYRIERSVRVTRGNPPKWVEYDVVHERNLDAALYKFARDYKRETFRLQVVPAGTQKAQKNQRRSKATQKSAGMAVAQ
jgi:hypothetical protein